MKTKTIIVALSLIAILALSGCGLGGSKTTGNAVAVGGDSKTVKIGLLLPLTGSAADIGKSNENSFQIAVKEINENGGINSKPIELVIEDTKGCDNKAATLAMQKLINIDKVIAVYSVCSNVALSTHPIAETNEIVHFGCASNPQVTDAGDYMFRIVPADDFAGEIAAKYVKDKFKANRVAILHCDNDWCVGLKDSFKEAFESLGGEILAEEQITTDALDARTELTKIKQSNPELIYFMGYPGETVVVFKQATELGLDMPFFGGDAWLDQSIPDQAGDTANNKYFTTPASGYSQEFEEKVDGDISICTPESYDVAYILAETMKKVGTNPTDIKNELYNLRDFKGESGVIGLDENGDLLGGALDIKTFVNGKIVDYDVKITS